MSLALPLGRFLGEACGMGGGGGLEEEVSVAQLSAPDWNEGVSGETAGSLEVGPSPEVVAGETRGRLPQVSPARRERDRARLSEVRRRLLRVGGGAVADDELLAVLLESTPREGSALLAAETLLCASGGLKGLLQQDGQLLSSSAAVGPRRAARILAAVELGRRVQHCVESRPKLTSPREIYRYLAPSLSALPREVFHVLALNSRNVLLGNVRISEGTANSCPVDPRAVFASAISLRAAAVVLAHNHPAGDPEPSREDLELTKQLSEAGRLLCIRVLDHLIIGDGSFVSLLERGQLSTQGVQARRASCHARRRAR